MKLPRSVLTICTVALIAGCAAKLPEVQGEHNATALQHLTMCQYGLAMNEVDLMAQTDDVELRGTSYLIKSAIFMDQGRTHEAEALYGRIVQENESIKDVAEARDAVESMLKDVRGVRKRARGFEVCPSYE